jgi:uncharacterized membrane protein
MMPIMRLKKWLGVLLVAGVVGLADASYLTWEHYRETVPPCEITWMTRMLGSWSDCGRVLNSEWATIGGVPVAGLGVVFYAGIIIMAVMGLMRSTELEANRPDRMKWSGLPKTWAGRWYGILAMMAVGGLVTSGVLVYLMFGVIKSVCVYCLVSAVNTVVIGVSAMALIGQRRREGEV